MEQLVILVVIGLISLVNWLIKRSADLKEKQRLEKAAQQGDYVPPQPPVTGPPPMEIDPAESMRKLMEALGLPMEEPAPVQRTPQLAPAQPSPLDEEFSPPAIPEFVAPPRPVFKPRVSPTSRSFARQSSAPAVVDHSKPSRFRELISSPDGIRNAIILSEILGKPRGVKPI